MIGVSTGHWIEGAAAKTEAAIESWQDLPDYASVNLSEDHAPATIACLLRRGVNIEAGLDSIEDAERLLSLRTTVRPLRILIELSDQDPARALRQADDILTFLSRHDVQRPVLLHGTEASAWPLVTHAFRRRLSTRIGLEDVDLLPSGNTAADNAGIVAAARDLRARPPHDG